MNYSELAEKLVSKSEDREERLSGYRTLVGTLSEIAINVKGDDLEETVEFGEKIAQQAKSGLFHDMDANFLTGLVVTEIEDQLV